MSNPHPLPHPSTQFAGQRSGYSQTKRAQIRAMQRVLFERILNPTTAPKEAASCACAYEKLERLLRSMGMKADPKPVDTLEIARLARKSQRPAPVVLEVDPSAKSA